MYSNKLVNLSASEITYIVSGGALNCILTHSLTHSVNNLHIITLYKLHNKLSCESRLSRSSCRTCRASRARRVERVVRVELVVSSVSSRAVRQAWHNQNA